MQWRRGFGRLYDVLALGWLIAGLSIISNTAPPEPLPIGHWVWGILLWIILPLLALRATGNAIAWIVGGFRDPEPKTIDSLLRDWKSNDN